MEHQIKISKEALEGLLYLNDGINEEISKKAIINAIKQIILFNAPALPIRSDIYENDVKLMVKKAEYGISCVLIIAAQHNIDLLQLKDILSYYKLRKETTSQIIESYEKLKDDLSNRLAKYGNSHDIKSLTNVDYEIQQYVIPHGDVVFKLTLQSFDHEKSGENVTIDEIYCNQEELQLLIVKLKDVERHCERISKIN